MRRWVQIVAIVAGMAAVGGCLGLGDFQDPEPTLTENVDFRSVSTGAFHACGLSADQDVYCWGLNISGQLGDGTGTDKSAPVQVDAGGIPFSDVSAGGLHSCAVAAAGDAYCWGDNVSAQLGVGDASAPSALPARVTGGLSFRKISAGVEHSCAITEDNLAFCWGSEEFGQLGNGQSGQNLRPVPVLVLGDLTFRSISAGARHTCAVTTDGMGYCWGSNQFGQLGNVEGTGSSTPTLVAGDLIFTEISVGEVHSCGVTADLEVYCWGNGSNGQLGQGDRSSAEVPVQVPFELDDLTTDVVVAAGGAHTCGVLGSTTRCWGLNQTGQLGDGTRTDRDSPAVVLGGLVFASVSVSITPLGSSCGITDSDVVYCWGGGTAGQLGNSAADDQLAPVKVSGQN